MSLALLSASSVMIFVTMCWGKLHSAAVMTITELISSSLFSESSLRAAMIGSISLCLFGGRVLLDRKASPSSINYRWDKHDQCQHWSINYQSDKHDQYQHWSINYQSDKQDQCQHWSINYQPDKQDQCQHWSINYQSDKHDQCQH